MSDAKILTMLDIDLAFEAFKNENHSVGILLFKLAEWAYLNKLFLNPKNSNDVIDKFIEITISLNESLEMIEPLTINNYQLTTT